MVQSPAADVYLPIGSAAPRVCEDPGSAGSTLTALARKGSSPMIDEFAKEYLHSDLRDGRATMLWKLEGLAEYDVRRPLTPTGTNLLGLIKHLTITEAWYFGEVFGRPFPERLPWRDDDADERADDAKLAALFDHKLQLADMWATEARVASRDRRSLPAHVGALGRDDRRARHRRARPCALVATPGREALQHPGPRPQRDQSSRRAR